MNATSAGNLAESLTGLAAVGTATQLQKDGEPQRLVTQRLRASQQIYCDNGAAFVGSAMDLWAYANGVILDFSRRGKPTDDEMIERAPARECLNGCCFPSLDDGQQKVDALRDCHEHRAHRAPERTRARRC